MDSVVYVNVESDHNHVAERHWASACELQTPTWGFQLMEPAFDIEQITFIYDFPSTFSLLVCYIFKSLLKPEELIMNGSQQPWQAGPKKKISLGQ